MNTPGLSYPSGPGRPRCHHSASSDPSCLHTAPSNQDTSDHRNKLETPSSLEGGTGLGMGAVRSPGWGVPLQLVSQTPDAEGGLLQGQPGYTGGRHLKIREKKNASRPYAGGGNEETPD